MQRTDEQSPWQSSLLGPFRQTRSADPPQESISKRDVRPILKDQCFSCHDGRKQKARVAARHPLAGPQGRRVGASRRSSPGDAGKSEASSAG